MSTRQSASRTVAVLGGGVAGLSAAHELAERGFRVTVYEASRTTGGKARSIFVPGSGTAGRRDLPGEHGLRFFPSFYRHLPDTTRRIPFGNDPDGVAGNLVATSRTRLARVDAPSFDVLTRFPTGLRDLADAVKLAVRRDLDLPREDLAFVGTLLLTLLTSSRERRFREYEQVPWWQFVQADRRSAAFRTYFCDVAVRSLVAMSPRMASARTTGVIGAQIWIDHARPGAQVDRLLNGPTHDAWLTPWRAHLERLGVRFRFGARATRLHLRDGRIAGVRIERRGPGRAVEDAGDITADHYVAAVPVERMIPLVSEELRREVWAQLKAHVNGRGRELLRDAALVDWFLADSIEHRADGTVANREPLLVNTAGSWRYRPEAVTRIPNLFLAADYVRTHTDIATMEAANEAARRAVNGVLAAAGASATPCRIWDLEEPAVFKPLQLLDRRRLERGLPHLLATPAA